MTNVVPITAENGPASTAMEREAVEGLLSNLRRFQSESGVDPSTVMFVVVGESEETGVMAHRVGWFTQSETNMRLCLAYGAVALHEKVLAPL